MAVREDKRIRLRWPQWLTNKPAAPVNPALADTLPQPRKSGFNPPSLKVASQMAGRVMDEIVAELIETNQRLPKSFFDWMTGEASDRVMMELERAYGNPRFMATLELDHDPLPVIRRWVLHWVCPLLVARFSSMGEYFPEFRQSEPVSLGQSMPAALDQSMPAPLTPAARETQRPAQRS